MTRHHIIRAALFGIVASTMLPSAPARADLFSDIKGREPASTTVVSIDRSGSIAAEDRQRCLHSLRVAAEKAAQGDVARRLPRLVAPDAAIANLALSANYAVTRAMLARPRHSIGHSLRLPPLEPLAPQC